MFNFLNKLLNISMLLSSLDFWKKTYFLSFWMINLKLSFNCLFTKLFRFSYYLTDEKVYSNLVGVSWGGGVLESNISIQSGFISTSLKFYNFFNEH